MDEGPPSTGRETFSTFSPMNSRRWWTRTMTQGRGPAPAAVTGTRTPMEATALKAPTRPNANNNAI